MWRHLQRVPSRAAVGAVVGAGLLAGCRGVQSALDPASEMAGQLAQLFWTMAIGAVAIWLIVVGFGVYALLSKKNHENPHEIGFWIIGGGIVFPTVLLAILLAYGLSLIPPLLAEAPPGSLRVHVSAERWWWRFRYELPDGRQFRSDNEIRLPVGEPVQFILESPDVIHAFWIPPLGGKMDTVPGRTNYLSLHPNRVGRFRGVCAEYCGASHALMAFDVFVMERRDFNQWADRQMEPAIASHESGEELFMRAGCGACHAVAGTSADGVVGPDLTHFGSRLSIGAGTLPNNRESLKRWLTQTDQIKPAVLMPHYGMLPPEEIDAIAGYLESLK